MTADNTLKRSLVVLILSSALSLNGCSTWRGLNNTEKGAAVGGATGAGLGAIVGSQVGAPGAGIAIGGAAGAVTGGVIGKGLDDLSSEVSSIKQSQRRQDAEIESQRRQIEQLEKK